jgi:AraC-like DNA-binding protein
VGVGNFKIADPGAGSPAWPLVQESRHLCARADQTIEAIRRTAGIVAETEDRLAGALLRSAAIRPRRNSELLALSELARANAERLREQAKQVPAPQETAAAAMADLRPAASETLRRAVAFINEHVRDDIAAADVARAAHVTVRAIQLAFRRHLSITPLGYLRQVRLENAHRELLAAGPGANVTTIAADWRFPSPSRFAARYRAAYGVPPSQTLRHGH